MDVSVIIVNYNTKQLLSDCLRSIYEQTKDIDFEVIVSDNGSTDGSIEMIKADFPQVDLIENNANLDFGKANNVAAKVAKGKYLFFLNSDTLLLNNAIKEFFNFVENRDDNCILGSWLVNKAGEVIQSYGYFSSFYKKLFQYFYEYFPFLLEVRLQLFPLKKKAVINDCFCVDFITGADLFIKSEVFKNLSGFDEQFFMYYEDEDLSRRAVSAGCKSFVIFTPKIIHLVGKSSRSSAGKLMIMEKSFLYYIKKFESKQKFMFHKAIYNLFVIFRFFSPVYSYKEKKALFKNTISLFSELSKDML